MGDYEIEIYRGDNLTWKVTVSDTGGNAFDLTGASIVFSVKQSVSDSSYLIQRKNATAGGGDDEIEDSDLENGEFKIHMVPANTNSIRPSKYVYDVQVTTSASKVYTILKDDFILKSEITR